MKHCLHTHDILMTILCANVTRHSFISRWIIHTSCHVSSRVVSWLRHIQVGKPVATFSILLTSILTLSFLTELIFLISFLSVSVRALGISCSDLLLRYSDLRVSLYLCLHCDICIRHMWARLDMYSFIYPNYSDKICVILYLFYSSFISVHFLHMLYITKL